MRRDQRSQDNHALLLAQAEAIEKKLPLIVAFILLPHTGQRRREQYEFMVEGLKQLEKTLQMKNIPFTIVSGTWVTEFLRLAKQLKPHSVYLDFSPLQGPQQSQKRLATHVECPVYVVDTHNIVPAWVTSDHEEFAAHTIRRKLHRLIETWCVEPPILKKHPFTLSEAPKTISWKDVETHIFAIKKSGIHHGFSSGEDAAHRTLLRFLETGITNYAADRNIATDDTQSGLSPYLHFGQISSLRIVLEILKVTPQPPQLFLSHTMPNYEGKATLQDGINAFVEEIIVRKELADNFCYYQKHYDSLSGAKKWAQESLADHADDPRDFLYTRSQWETASTHDGLWNAAQQQLLMTGKIHGYMRMYWAKKILEWSASPDEAVKTAIYLNDAYSVDGGDPNGYVGVLWSMAGVHDRAWFNRSVYGKIRYMNANGASKKFDTKRYIETWTS